MKTDLATSIVAAIIGVVAAYFICNMVLPPVADVTFKTLSSSTTYTLDQPDPEIFNYRAINPTVEVYVGQCAEYNEYGECIENIKYIEDEEIVVENETNEEAEDNNSSENTNGNNENNQNSQNNGNQENQPEVNEETQNGTSN